MYLKISQVSNGNIHLVVLTQNESMFMYFELTLSGKSECIRRVNCSCFFFFCHFVNECAGQCDRLSHNMALGVSPDDKESFVWHMCVKDDINSQELHSGKTPSGTLCYCFEAFLSLCTSLLIATQLL